MFEPVRNRLIPVLSAVLCLYTLAEVNFPRLRPQSQLALFVMLGLVLCFLSIPARERWREKPDRAPGRSGSGRRQHRWLVATWF